MNPMTASPVVVRIVREQFRSRVEFRNRSGELLDSQYMDKYVPESHREIRIRKRELSEGVPS